MAVELSAFTFTVVTYFLLIYIVAIALYITYTAVEYRDELLEREQAG
jgi:cell division protein FtsL